MFTNRPAKSTRPHKVSGPGSLNDVATEESLGSVTGDAYTIRDRVQQKLLTESEGEVNLAHLPQMKQIIETLFNKVLAEENLLYTRSTRARILDWVVADILSFGPLEPLLKDPTVTEVMVNGYQNVYVERYGRIEPAAVTFENDDHVMRIIDRIVAPLGRRVDEGSPMVDARLPSGYRVNAIIPPLALNGPLLTIRKFAQTPFTVQDLIANGSLTTQLVMFLKACVEARLNIVVSGGTGSGKTTLLNTLSTFIPGNERIITIEDIAELQLKQEHVARVEKRPPNIEGKGEITIRQLVINSLRMRPDRILVGEARGGEALDMLQAMNTGHDGSMTTIHSNGPRDTLRRIETMVLMAGMELPLRAIREQVASAVDLIVHMERLRDGGRKVVHVTEVQGMEGDTIVTQDLFLFDQQGIHNGRVVGSLKSTGLRPSFSDKFTIYGIELPTGLFETGRQI
jgi:pilus assembly protein CpaF